jgi:cytochrome c oxidase cbb3-type subunit 3
MRAALLLLLLSGFDLLLPTAQAAHDGARLYASHCAACHGSRGTGGVGVPLALPDFLAQVDDAYLSKSIRLGRPGRVMPAFAHFSDAETAAIVHHIRSWQSGPKVVPVKVNRGNAAHGARLYAAHCAECHGANGEGGHGTGVTFSRPRDLPILAPALNNAGFLASVTDQQIKATLTYGRKGTPMSSFLAKGLSERDLDDVVAFVRDFERDPLPTTATKVAADEPAVLVRHSNYGMNETIDKLKIAFAGANMRIIRIGPLDEGLVDKGKENPKRMIVDACDFHFLNKALAVDPRVGLFLPCRVTLLEDAGKVRAMTLNPKRLSVLFNNNELDELCTQMRDLYVDILDEATL